MLQNELNSVAAHFSTLESPCLATNQIDEGCKKLCCTKSLHVVHFTDHRQTCFATSSWGNFRIWHDSRAFLSYKKSVFRKLVTTWFVERHVWTWNDETCSIAFQLVLLSSNVAKQVAHFCSAFYRSFVS